MTALTSGETLSHYRLIEPIGQGGMGEVWLAEDTLLPRRVAIKLLHSHLGADDEAVERLMREARAAASIDHPNVITIYEAGLHQGQPFLVMQYLEGDTLEQRLARGALAVDDAVALARGIADALAEVHALGIVHRDLKPANIILTARGPRVLDFGVSAMRGNAKLTSTGVSLGTPLTMSPEQFRGEPADSRSDLWALGVILYEALTGVRPFDGDSYPAIAHRVMNEEPVSTSERNAAVGPKLDLVVGKLLRKDPALRYARAEDLLADLTEAVRDTNGKKPAKAVEPSLAVLYFEVLSPDPDDQFLAAGLTEDLIVDLARVPGLKVSARGEVLPYRERTLPPRTVARELGVEFVVQGSVRRAGVRGRIGAQLVRALDGHAVWAERFDRTLEDLFDVQAEVSRLIVEALEITLRPKEREMLKRAPSSNREAYAYYLRARAYGDERRRASSQRAEECYRHALALDPDFVLAHAALAECLAARAMAWWESGDVLEEAKTHAVRAIELDAALPEAHMALGMIHRTQGNAAGVLDEVRAAQKIDSNDPEIMHWVGRSYMNLGRPQDGIGILERAVALRPRDYKLLSTYNDCADMLGRKDVVANTLARIREVLVEALERAPDDTYGRSMLSIVLAQRGETEAGIAQAERAIADHSEDGRVLYNVACTFTYAGDFGRAIQLLRELVTTNPGFPRDWPHHDPDFVPLRELPEFIALFGPAE